MMEMPDTNAIIAPEVGAVLSGAGQAESAADPTHDPKPQVFGGLSDTVFGLAITLLATALNLQPGNPGQWVQQLIGFSYSFFVIALIWLRRHHLLRLMRSEPLGFTRLNFVLLFLVISYTFTLRLFTQQFSSTSNPQSTSRTFTVGGPSPALEAMFLFALVTALVMATLAGLHEYALRRDLIAPKDRPPIVLERNVTLIAGIAFVVSLPFVFIDYRLAVLCWVLSLPVQTIYRQRQARSAKQKAKVL